MEEKTTSHLLLLTMMYSSITTFGISALEYLRPQQDRGSHIKVDSQVSTFASSSPNSLFQGRLRCTQCCPPNAFDAPNHMSNLREMLFAGSQNLNIDTYERDLVTAVYLKYIFLQMKRMGPTAVQRSSARTLVYSSLASADHGYTDLDDAVCENCRDYVHGRKQHLIMSICTRPPRSLRTFTYHNWQMCLIINKPSTRWGLLKCDWWSLLLVRCSPHRCG